MSFLPRDRDWHPRPYDPRYKTSTTRAPSQPPLRIGQTASELTGPIFPASDIGPLDHDLLANHGPGNPIGERIAVHGRVTDENGRAVPHTLVEIWQANAGGRYRHRNDHYLAPLDPGFGGCGRMLTDAEGRYRFLTVKPGAYPWPNGPNTWRPAHIHFSVFGEAFAQRLVTQMYFEGDPLIARCPIVSTIPDPRAIDLLIAPLDMDAATPFDHLAYRFDIVLRGRDATPFEGAP